MAESGKTWAIVGASRGIGLEFVIQLLARGNKVIATVRGHSLKQAASQWQGVKQCSVFECDMLSEPSIDAFAEQLNQASVSHIDYLVLNAGVLKYPTRATELSYDDFALHLHTNCIGPIICAQRIVKARIKVGTIVFISSDSGSAQAFRPEEDGFAAYASSKAALNQMLRHFVAELQRAESETAVIALHPGEVKTDMANIDLGWEITDEMTPAQSVEACIPVIESKSIDDSGTFWTWRNRVRRYGDVFMYP
ncbi:hypothetical protein DOTSEDRAFT_68555 [Dothistroma septosporum NZE10]|uniref:Uncharacterized protein n=1 Tax=Dothistroma septosporum (strain NZE10 / CBS 128990) TaxID=675120 RepID=N1Q4X4_DOTSN|nr:hypothetical protein DOTSEDRAFT_68555 [Dothistroma septosporum NZE10]